MSEKKLIKPDDVRWAYDPLSNYWRLVVGHRIMPAIVKDDEACVGYYMFQFGRQLARRFTSQHAAEDACEQYLADLRMYGFRWEEAETEAKPEPWWYDMAINQRLDAIGCDLESAQGLSMEIMENRRFRFVNNSNRDIA